MIGVAKADSVVDYSLLEYCLRNHLNKTAQRAMAVLNPLKVVITNYPENKTEELQAINNPEDESMGKRNITFSREIYIEKDDFMEDPPKNYYRLSPGAEVRLRYAYIIKCEQVIKDEKGNIIELRCTYDPETKSGGSSTKKVKAAIHWVSKDVAINAEVRLYDFLFTKADPDDVLEGQTFLDNLNPNSLVVLKNCKVEPFLKNFAPGEKFQFERHGYFCLDIKDSKPDNLVFNRTATLKDTWSKIKDK